MKKWIDKLGSPQPRPRNRPLEEFHAEKDRKKAWKKVSMGKVSVPVIRMRSMVGYALVLLGLAALVGLGNEYQKNQLCQGVEITLSHSTQTPLLEEADIRSLLRIDQEEQALTGRKLVEIDLEGLEDSLELHPSVETAEVFRSLKGVVYMELQLRNPVARLVNNDGTHLYIDRRGNKFPVGGEGGENVILVRGNFDEPLFPVDSFACSTIGEALAVINYVNDNEFWHTQVSELVLLQNGELVLYPQIGSMTMEFGFPERVEQKFTYLKTFYQDVIPRVGWDYYEQISVKYKGQVVATRT